MLQRNFSRREKVLLIILSLLVAAISYYFLVWKPVSERADAAALRQADAENETVIEEAKLAQMQQMQAEIDEMDALEIESGAASIPPYDNAKRVMQLLNGVLTASLRYEINFNNVAFNGNLAARSLHMRFECDSYEKAKDIVRSLYSAPYRCHIGNFSFRSADGGAMLLGGLSVEMDITFYEFLSAEDIQAIAAEEAEE